jgi:hypothetical protein
MNPIVPLMLATARLRLRLFEEHGCEALHEMFSDEACVRYTIEQPLRIGKRGVLWQRILDIASGVTFEVAWPCPGFSRASGAAGFGRLALALIEAPGLGAIAAALHRAPAATLAAARVEEQPAAACGRAFADMGHVG